MDRGQDEEAEATALQPGQKQKTVLWKVPADYTGYDAGHTPWRSGAAGSVFGLGFGVVEGKAGGCRQWPAPCSLEEAPLGG